MMDSSSIGLKGAHKWNENVGFTNIKGPRSQIKFRGKLVKPKEVILNLRFHDGVVLMMPLCLHHRKTSDRVTSSIQHHRET